MRESAEALIDNVVQSAVQGMHCAGCAAKIEKDLMAAVPKSDWKELPWLFKEHGRATCKAPMPSCSKCVLNKICPQQGVTKQH